METNMNSEEQTRIYSLGKCRILKEKLT